MTDREIYRTAGIDYDKGLERFMGNDKLYKEFLMKFLYDGSFEEFCAGASVGDLAMAEKEVHTLKGTAGNLSMTRLFRAAGATVEAIHAGKQDDALQPLIDEVNAAYQAACDAVRQEV